MIDAQDSGKLLGAFSLALKVVRLDNLSNGSRKRLLLNSKRSAVKHITEIPVILIAQFGKNYNFPKSITGIELMSLVLKQVEKARSIVSGQTIVLDSVNNEKVIAFYEQFGFVKYGTIVNDGEASYQPMALDLSKLNL